MRLELRTPSRAELPGYVDALNRGWSPDNIGLEKTAREHLARIAADADAFLASLEDREAKGEPVKLPDGQVFARLPGYNRWLWDGEFCGRIGIRWQPGTADLPAHVLGHIGYTVVPWKEGRGYATAALRLLLPQARDLGLPHVILTTELDNVPSQRVILSNGGVLVGRFDKPDAYGGGEGLKFRIDL